MTLPKRHGSHFTTCDPRYETNGNKRARVESLLPMVMHLVTEQRKIVARLQPGSLCQPLSAKQASSILAPQSALHLVKFGETAP